MTSFPYERRDVWVQDYTINDKTTTLVNQVQIAGQGYLIGKTNNKGENVHCVYPNSTSKINVNALDEYGFMSRAFIYMHNGGGYPLLFPGTLVPVLFPSYKYVKTGNNWSIIEHLEYGDKHHWLVGANQSKSLKTSFKFKVDKLSDFPLIKPEFKFDDKTFNFLHVQENVARYYDRIDIEKYGTPYSLDAEYMYSYNMSKDKPNAGVPCIYRVFVNGLSFVYTTNCFGEGIPVKMTHKWGMHASILNETESHVPKKSAIDDAISQSLVERYSKDISTFIKDLNNDFEPHGGRIFKQGGGAFKEIVTFAEKQPEMKDALTKFKAGEIGKNLNIASTVRDIDVYMFVPGMPKCTNFKSCYDSNPYFEALYTRLKELRNTIHNDLIQNMSVIKSKILSTTPFQGTETDITFVNSTNEELVFVDENSRNIVKKFPSSLYRDSSSFPCSKTNMKNIVGTAGKKREKDHKECFPLFTRANFTIQYTVGALDCKFILVCLVMNVECIIGGKKEIHKVRFLDISIPYEGDAIKETDHITNIVKSGESNIYHRIMMLMYNLTVQIYSELDTITQLVAKLGDYDTVMKDINDSNPALYQNADGTVNVRKERIVADIKTLKNKKAKLDARHAFLKMFMGAYMGEQNATWQASRGVMSGLGESIATMDPVTMKTFLPSALPSATKNAFPPMDMGKGGRMTRVQNMLNQSQNGKGGILDLNTTSKSLSMINLKSNKVASLRTPIVSDSVVYREMSGVTHEGFKYLLGDIPLADEITKMSMNNIKTFLDAQEPENKQSYLNSFHTLVNTPTKPIKLKD